MKFNVEMDSDTLLKNEMMVMMMLLLMDVLNLVILTMAMLAQEDLKLAKTLVLTEQLLEQLSLKIKQLE